MSNNNNGCGSALEWSEWCNPYRIKNKIEEVFLFPCNILKKTIHFNAVDVSEYFTFFLEIQCSFCLIVKHILSRDKIFKMNCKFSSCWIILNKFVVVILASIKLKILLIFMNFIILKICFKVDFTNF